MARLVCSLNQSNFCGCDKYLNRGKVPAYDFSPWLLGPIALVAKHNILGESVWQNQAAYLTAARKQREERAESQSPRPPLGSSS